MSRANKREPNPGPAVLPVLVLANPPKKAKKADAPAPAKKPAKKPAAKPAAAKKKPAKPKKGTKKMASAKQVAAAKKNIKKAQAANRKKAAAHPDRGNGARKSNPKKPKKKSGASKPKSGKKSGSRKSPRRPNPPKSGRRNKRRRNGPSERVKTGLMIGGGILAGGAAAGSAEYVMAGMEATATPPKRALVHGGAAILTAIPAIAWTKSAPFFGPVAGSFGGLAFKNLVQWIWSGPSKTSSSSSSSPGSGATAGTGGADPNATGARLFRPGGMRGVQIVEPRQLTAAQRMGGVVLDRASLRGVILNRSR